MWAIWKERNRRLFEELYEDLTSVWDFFLYFVGSLADTHYSFSCISFDTFSCNLESLLLQQETHP